MFLGLLLRRTLSVRECFYPDLDYYRTLIGSHTLPVKRNHWIAAAMTRSARNRRWYLLTVAIVW